MTRGASAPKILVTGFGPFPGAPDNPTEPLVRALAAEPPEQLGAGTLKAVVLPVDYRKSWPVLRRLYRSFAPDVIMHFGLSSRARSVVVERQGSRLLRRDRCDAAGFVPRSGVARRAGPESLPSNLPVDTIVQKLVAAGFPAEASDDAGGYVCNATFYRSLISAPPGSERLVGFIHVPPEGTASYTSVRLRKAAALILVAATDRWRERSRSRA